MTLENDGSKAIRLESITTPVAERAELHDHLMTGSIMKMEKVSDFTLAPHQNAILQPGGMHVMLFDLKQPLRAGASFPLTFTYNGGALMTTTVNVLSPEEIDAMKKDAGSARQAHEAAAGMYRSGRTGNESDMTEPPMMNQDTPASEAPMPMEMPMPMPVAH